MNQDHPTINRLFQAEVLPRANLASDIIKVIHKRQHRALVINRVMFTSATAASIAAMVPAISHMASQLSQTGFAQYVSLLFSDGSAILTNAKDFGLLLAESLPIMSVILVASILLFMVWSVKKLLEKPLSFGSFSTLQI